MKLKLAAAKGIAELVQDNELNEQYIVPTHLITRVSGAVSEAVKSVARQQGSKTIIGPPAAPSAGQNMARFVHTSTGAGRPSFIGENAMWTDQLQRTVLRLEIGRDISGLQAFLGTRD